MLAPWLMPFTRSPSELQQDHTDRPIIIIISTAYLYILNIVYILCTARIAILHNVYSLPVVLRGFEGAKVINSKIMHASMCMRGKDPAWNQGYTRGIIHIHCEDFAGPAMYIAHYHA